jgi:hypothetical protein
MASWLSQKSVNFSSHPTLWQYIAATYLEHLPTLSAEDSIDALMTINTAGYSDPEFWNNAAAKIVDQGVYRTDLLSTIHLRNLFV